MPRRLRADRFLRVALLLFWGLFFFSFELSPALARLREQLRRQTGAPRSSPEFFPTLDSKNGVSSSFMVGFYIHHNTSIGLECFALGLLFGVGGLVALVFNAVQLGAVFGYMSTVPEWHVFSQFVTAHGPFELTAIALSAAAGMRLGFALIDTHGLSRSEAPRQAGREAMPVMGAAMVDVCLGRLDRGFFVSQRRTLFHQGGRGNRLGHFVAILYCDSRPAAGRQRRRKAPFHAT